MTAARDNARQVREEISSDMWEQLNGLYLRLKQGRGEGTWSARPHYLSRLIIEGVHLFEGVTDATMGHGEGWQLSVRHGVCQDFAHIMIALVRGLGVPCRYVSGYLYRQPDRNVRSSDGATHAWVEALLPDVGWIGFDPTNNLVADEQHIRVAIGRDYADVPPTRGVFKGASAVHSELGVAVTVGTAWPMGGDAVPLLPWMSREATPVRESDASQQQQ